MLKLWAVKRAMGVLVMALVLMAVVTIHRLVHPGMADPQRWVAAALQALNANWPPWVNNVANIVQIVGGLSALSAVVFGRSAVRRSTS